MQATQRRWIERALVAVALAGVAFAAFLPHWDPLSGQANEYPVHLDEYIHWGYAKGIATDGTLAFRDPFSGSAPTADAPAVNERGFHAFLAAFVGLTGLDWVALFVYGPVVVAVFLALCAYALARRWGGGIYAIVLVATIPTTLRFLGPGFFVPIAFALPLFVLGLLALVSRPDAPWLALAIAAALWPIHAMAALILTAILGAWGLAYLRTSPLRAGLITACALLGFVLAAPVYAAHLDAGVATPSLSSSVATVRMYGWIPLVAAALGITALAASPRREDRTFAYAVGGATLALVVVLVVRARFDLEVFQLYDRSVLMVETLAALLGGTGLGILARRARRLRAGRALRWNPGATLAHVAIGALLVGNLVASVQAQAEDPEYVVLTPRQYEQIQLAGAQFPGVAGRAVVDGLHGLAFSDLTGRPTLFPVDPSSQGPPPIIREFFENGANDTALLVETRTILVVTDRPVLNEDLVAVGKGVYVLREDYVARMSP